MDAEPSTGKAKTRGAGEEEKVEEGVKPIAGAEISEEIRDELTALMQELLMKCHELSFEYSTLDCKDIMDCPLGKKCKELFKTVKKLNELVRGFAQPKTKITYTR